MQPEIVIACYRPHDGQEEALLDILRQHIPTLLKAGLITDRPPVLMRSANGTIIEVFEWRANDSAERAHHHPDVAKIWRAIGAIADMPQLDSLEESRGRFPHFKPITL